MAVERGEEQQQPPALSPWDCGSPLYDAFELASVYRVLDTHLMALPYARRASPPRARGTGDVAALAERAAVAVAKTKGRGRRRRTVTKAARVSGKAVLHSIFRSVATCGGRRL
ncbi:hypothetical protein GQ55_3G164500 [Panicum hallii var. hallii]|uniref:Uncharacterized protein n=1 Tax=Panicum hallii var. hallii TaxID=1504633 RepID=A0A2T7EA64_9POAL|nr:hypothetical protein GQ55_3G164500 [Panicum hallii var. hallii]